MGRDHFLTPQQSVGEWHSGSLSVFVAPASSIAASHAIDVKKMPESQTFKLMFPELFAAMIGEPLYGRAVIVGIVTISVQSHHSAVLAAFGELAKLIQSGTEPLCYIDYFIGISGFARTSDYLGLDVFDTVEEVEMDRILDDTEKHPAKRGANFVVIDREKFLKLYSAEV